MNELAEQPAISQESRVQQTTSEVAPEPDQRDPEQELVDQLSEEVAQPAATDDEAEEEIDGLKIKGRKEQIERLKSERLMQADYTRKTQALAEEREHVRQQAEASQAYLNEIAAIRAVDMRLAEFDKVDWRAVIDADPAQAQKLRLDRDDLARYRETLVQSALARQAQTAQQQQASLATLKSQAAAYLSKEVPGWSPTRDAEVAEYVAKAGVPTAAIPNVIAHMPQWGVMAHKALLYDTLVAKATKKTPPAPQEAPVTRIAATKAAASKDPGQMTDAEFAQWRKRQIAQRR